MAEILMKVITGVMLVVCGIQDLKTKKITLWIILVSIILIIACLPFCNTIKMTEIAGGIAIGVSVIVISYITGGKIGLGDGLILCATGIGLGFWGNLELFGIALLFAAIVSIILLVLRLADRKKCIPFVPFLLFAYLFLIIIEMKGVV